MRWSRMSETAWQDRHVVYKIQLNQTAINIQANEKLLQITNIWSTNQSYKMKEETNQTKTRRKNAEKEEKQEMEFENHDLPTSKVLVCFYYMLWKNCEDV